MDYPKVYILRLDLDRSISSTSGTLKDGTRSRQSQDSIPDVLAQSLPGSPPHPLLRRSLAILREVCLAVHPGTDSSNHQRSSTSHESVAAGCSHMTSVSKKCWHLEPPDHQIMHSSPQEHAPVPSLARIAIFRTRPSICWMRLARASS